MEAMPAASTVSTVLLGCKSPSAAARIGFWLRMLSPSPIPAVNGIKMALKRAGGGLLFVSGGFVICIPFTCASGGVLWLPRKCCVVASQFSHFLIAAWKGFQSHSFLPLPNATKCTKSGPNWCFKWCRWQKLWKAVIQALSGLVIIKAVIAVCVIERAADG